MNKNRLIFIALALLITFTAGLFIRIQSSSAAASIKPLAEETTFKQLSNWRTWLTNNQETPRTSQQKSAYRNKIANLNANALKTVNQRTQDRTKLRRAVVNEQKAAELKAEYDYAIKEGNSAVKLCKKDAEDYYNEDLLFITGDYKQQLSALKKEANSSAKIIKQAYRKQISKKQKTVIKKKTLYSKIKNKAKSKKQLLKKRKQQLIKAQSFLGSAKNQLRKELRANSSSYQEQVNYIKQDFAQQKTELEDFYQQSLKECDLELQAYLDDYNQIVVDIEADYAMIWKDELVAINNIDQSERERIKTIRDKCQDLVSDMPDRN
jgi:hypothetical protein